jgi:hypothetical protein
VGKTETYRERLIDMYEPYPKAADLVERAMREYLFDSYMQFSSANTINNDSRSDDLHRATVSITISALLAFLTFVPFMLGRVGLPPWPTCFF